MVNQRYLLTIILAKICDEFVILENDTVHSNKNHKILYFLKKEKFGKQNLNIVCFLFFNNKSFLNLYCICVLNFFKIK